MKKDEKIKFTMTFFRDTFIFALGIIDNSVAGWGGGCGGCVDIQWIQ